MKNAYEQEEGLQPTMSPPAPMFGYEGPPRNAPVVSTVSEEEDPLIGIAQFARLLNKPTSTIWRWCHDGLYPMEQQQNKLLKIRLSVANKFLKGANLAVKKITKETLKEAEIPKSMYTKKAGQLVDEPADSGDEEVGDDD